MGKSQELYQKAKKLIPGGTQLLSKRPEMFLPEKWPAYYSRAKGCYIWDLDNNKYTDTSYMGIGANVLGYADDDVNRAVISSVENGSMCTLNAPEEYELAELLLELHPWAEQVRYAKTGGEAMSIAVRIARAYTRKDIVLFCGYHGWTDWYLSANLSKDNALDGHLLKGLMPAGVPRGLTGTVFPFNYNNTQEFLDLIEKYKDNIAAVVMEPVRNDPPDMNFLKTIRETTKKEGIVFIIDEITAGFRLCCGGAHKTLDITPDMSIFAKALSNGFPMSAIIGKEEIMQSAQSTFISSTYWTERTGLCAAIATIHKFRQNQVENHLLEIGAMVKKGWADAAEKYQLSLHICGIDPLAHFDFEYDNSLSFKTLFTQEMLKRGFLATNAFYASFSHTTEIVQAYLESVDEVFRIINEAYSSGSVESYLEGPVCQSGFQRLI